MKAEFQRIARTDKKAFLRDQCKKIEKIIERERLEISLRKLEIPGEHFREGNGIPLQYSCLENPMDGGAW